MLFYFLSQIKKLLSLLLYCNFTLRLLRNYIERTPTDLSTQQKKKPLSLTSSS